MKYLEFTFTLNPAGEAASDVLSAVLADIGFESFVHTDELDRPRVAVDNDFPEAPVFAPKAENDEFKAYIQTALFDADALDAAVADFPLPGVTVGYRMVEAEDKNWNEEWERHYFQPLVLEGEGGGRARCVVASTFHRDVPEADCSIFINPQMSFGTGHHQTTAQMLRRLLEEDVAGAEVLDMGCGTSILAILARMRGAAHCVAVDFDEWCVRNSLDNIALNHLEGIDVLHGDAACLAPYAGRFDLILANINRNILLADLPHYVASLRPGGRILMSGFYTADTPMLRARAEELGLAWSDGRSLDDWACLRFIRPL